MTRSLLDLHNSHQGELIATLIPGQITVSQVTQLLRDLLSEGVSVRSFDRLLQVVSEKVPLVGTGRSLLEETRIALRRAIMQPFILSSEKRLFGSVSAAIDGALMHAERSGGIPPLTLIQEITAWIAARRDLLHGIVVGRASRAILRDILRHNGIEMAVYAREELIGFSYEIRELLTLVEDEPADDSSDLANNATSSFEQMTTAWQ
jgi:flagellar biosynthesis component FlhA